MIYFCFVVLASLFGILQCKVGPVKDEILDGALRPGGGDFRNFFLQHALNMNFLKENAFFTGPGAGISDLVLSPGAGITDHKWSRPREFPGVPPGGGGEITGTRIERNISKHFSKAGCHLSAFRYLHSSHKTSLAIFYK